jgi:hypothetical protein
MAGVVGYDELRLRIDWGEGRMLRVLATVEQAEASGTFTLPFNELQLENFVLRAGRSRGRRGDSGSALADAKRFGGELFQAVFSGQVRDLYHDALTRAEGAGRGLRVTLCLSGAAELMDVPWEYLYDAPNFLAASAFTPVVRYLDLPRASRVLRVEPPINILAMVSSPAELEALDVPRERDNLERALADLLEQGAVMLHWLERPTLTALLSELQSGECHVLHYIGHGYYDAGSERGVLILEDDNGRSRDVDGDELGQILHDHRSLRLAVLNACEGARTGRNDPFAGVAESLVRRDIPAVVAMQFEITDEAAILFAGGFYRAVAAGLPVDAALARGRLAIFAGRRDGIEWGTPVLFMRVADGRIFDLPEAPAAASGTTTPESPGALIPPAAVTATNLPATTAIRAAPDTAATAHFETGSRNRASPQRAPRRLLMLIGAALVPFAGVGGAAILTSGAPASSPFGNYASKLCDLVAEQTTASVGEEQMFDSHMRVASDWQQAGQAIEGQVNGMIDDLNKARPDLGAIETSSVTAAEITAAQQATTAVGTSLDALHGYVANLAGVHDGANLVTAVKTYDANSEPQVATEQAILDAKVMLLRPGCSLPTVPNPKPVVLEWGVSRNGAATGPGATTGGNDASRSDPNGPSYTSLIPAAPQPIRPPTRPFLTLSHLPPPYGGPTTPTTSGSGVTPGSGTTTTQPGSNTTTTSGPGSNTNTTTTKPSVLAPNGGPKTP